MSSADPHYWLGYLATTMRRASLRAGGDTKTLLDQSLREFARSPVCGPGLRSEIAPKRKEA